MFKVCIDTGGTFADCVILDRDANLQEFKSPRTSPNFPGGVMNVFEEAATVYAMSRNAFIGRIESIILRSIVASNALVTRNVARTAMITRGFSDILEMRQSLKIETHSRCEPSIPSYEPTMPRDQRFEVEEETSMEGEPIKSVDAFRYEYLYNPLIYLIIVILSAFNTLTVFI